MGYFRTDPSTGKNQVVHEYGGRDKRERRRFVDVDAVIEECAVVAARHSAIAALDIRNLKDDGEQGEGPHDNYPVGVEGGNKRPPFKAGENAAEEVARAKKLAKKKR